jgi:hypothetical protein
MVQAGDMLADEDYPACTMGRAAEIIGWTPDFLRRLGEAKLFDPFRSGGGHRPAADPPKVGLMLLAFTRPRLPLSWSSGRRRTLLAVGRRRRRP